MRVEILADEADGGAVVYLLVRIHAEGDPGTGRSPANLAVVIDRSSSMRGPRIRRALEAATKLVERLGPTDRLTLIGFDGSARTIFGPAQVTDESRAEAIARLEELETGVGTNLAAAIRSGADAIASGFVRGAISRLILLTDGQPSVGITDAATLCRMVETEHKRGVSTTTMGIGQSFEDELLAEMARRGRGGFYYLAHAEDIAAAFGRELDGVFSIAASKTELKFLPYAEVTSVEVLHSLPSRASDDGLVVEIGEVATTTPRQVLLKLVRGENATSANLGTVMVTFSGADGDAGDPHLLGVARPTDRSGSGSAASRSVQNERLRLAVASAVDTAWARRASSDAKTAVAAMSKVRDAVLAARSAKAADADVIDGLLADMSAAELAVTKSAEERSRLRRGMREQSQVTLMGRSVVTNLPDSPSDD